MGSTVIKSETAQLQQFERGMNLRTPLCPIDKCFPRAHSESASDPNLHGVVIAPSFGREFQQTAGDRFEWTLYISLLPSVISSPFPSCLLIIQFRPAPQSADYEIFKSPVALCNLIFFLQRSNVLDKSQWSALIKYFSGAVWKKI